MMFDFAVFRFCLWHFLYVRLCIFQHRAFKRIAILTCLNCQIDWPGVFAQNFCEVGTHCRKISLGRWHSTATLFSLHGSTLYKQFPTYGLLFLKMMFRSTDVHSCSFQTVISFNIVHVLVNLNLNI